MSEPEQDIHALMSKYVAGTLTDAEAKIVLDSIQKSEQLRLALSQLVRCDWLLRIRYGQVNPTFSPKQEKNIANETTYSYNSLGKDEELSLLLAWNRVCPALDRNASKDNLANSPRINASHRNADSQEQNEEEWDAFAIYKAEEEERAAAVRHKPKFKWKFGDYVFIANVVLAICLVCAVCIHEHKDSNSIIAEQTEFPARIDELIRPVWKEGTNSWCRGQWLGFGNISLVEGTIKIVMRDGAEVIVEGPSEFAIRSENAIFLSTGQLSATVPSQATGFEVVTPLATFIDRGTEFFLDVSKESTKAVTVKGLVDMKTSRKVVSLPKGKSVAFNGNTFLNPGRSLADRFISQNFFTQKLISYVKVLREEKRLHDIELDTDPSLWVRFDAENFDHGTIPNSSAVGKEMVPALHVVGCNTGEGRWYKTKSLLYQNGECYGQFSLPGSCTSMTLMASIRMNKLQNQGNTLLASGDFMKKPGSVFWQITREGKIIFYITSNEMKSESYATPEIFSPGDIGGWFELAVVLNANNKTISHYVNGQRVAKIPWNTPIPVHVGDGILGNTLEKNYRINNRNWDGAIDEFKIFNRAIVPKKP